jgi:copper chaperone CopZ
MSRVVEAQERFKRCCIAFADLCCAQSRTDEGCCETKCIDSDKYETPLLEFKDDKSQEKEEQASSLKAEEVEVAAVTAGSEMEEIIVLEVIGMDCPDCLSKVTRAVQILEGVDVRNADGVRGLVNVSYDPRTLCCSLTS